MRTLWIRMGVTAVNGTTVRRGLEETVVFLRYFEDLPDPRQQGKV
jgi:hypothetical protein